MILGATGDLTGRFLLPALAALDAAGELAEVEVLGIGHSDRDDDAYRTWAREQLAEHAGDLPEEVRDGLAGRLRHRTADVTSVEDLRDVLDAADGVPVLYLALPNTVFRPTVEALAEAGLPDGARVVVEKPFGTDLADARELNAALHRLLPEDRIFRVDHFLAEPTVLNVLGLRFANRLFEAVWNREHVARVELVFDEGLGLEGRAGYYDGAGALRDMLQNHLLQLLALVAMERPGSVTGPDLAARKAEVLRAVRPPDDPRTGSVRGRYTAGEADGRALPDYTAEDGVDPGRCTETYAEFTVTVDTERWAGVPFRLRTGKALGTGRQEVVVHFRPVPDAPFGDGTAAPEVLRLRFSPDAVGLEVNLNGRDDPFDLERVALTASRVADADLPAYGYVLRGLLAGDHTLSISDVEAEEGWRIVAPVLAAWAGDEVPLLEYPAGSAGPA
jgi:glucose-6-phosphate 1-dehydrogenase